MIASLGLSVIAAASQVSAPASLAQTDEKIISAVRYASARFALPEAWIWAVMRVESAGNQQAISPKGASGLMQLMPDTWAEMRNKYGLGPDVFNVRDNIIAGAAYLREMCDRFGSPAFLAAYNAGPGRLETSLRTGRPLPTETTNYVLKIRRQLGDGLSSNAQTCDLTPVVIWQSSTLFVAPEIAAPMDAASPFTPRTSPFVSDLTQTAPPSVPFIADTIATDSKD